MPGEVHVPIRHEGDILKARHDARALGSEVGFDETCLTLIATAISELARNIMSYAGVGEIEIRSVADDRRGITVVAHDDGPGIENLALAMQDGYSTSGGLGLGLPGTRRLMDDFEVISEVGRGTTITTTKWLTDRRRLK